MSGSVGYNFTANTTIKSTEVNSNFEWVRGHYLPVNQTGTWNNTTGVYDLGSATAKWRHGYLSGNLDIAGNLIGTITSTLTIGAAYFGNTITAASDIAMTSTATLRYGRVLLSSLILTETAVENAAAVTASSGLATTVA